MKKLVKFKNYGNEIHAPMRDQIAWFYCQDRLVVDDNPVGEVEWENVEASMYWLLMALSDKSVESNGDLEDIIFYSRRFSLCYFKELDSVEIVQWRLHGKICDL
jgi:hypothetical protein